MIAPCRVYQCPCADLAVSEDKIRRRHANRLPLSFFSEGQYQQFNRVNYRYTLVEILRPFLNEAQLTD
jgi:hypothetical protein